MEIFSFPQMNRNKDDLQQSRLTYGGNDSTVKFFDFTSDLGYLMASMQGIRSYLDITNNVFLLTHDRLRSAIFYFVKELIDADVITDSDKEERMLAELEENKDSKEVGLVLSEETLKFLTDLETEIESKALKGLFKKSQPQERETFKAFVVMLQHKAAISALFSIKGGKSRSSYNLIFGSSSENVKVSNTIAYTLKEDNLFDQFSTADPFGKQKALEQWATSYLQGYPTEIRVKALGIPEMDTLQEVNRSRVILFDVHDLSKERITGKREIHWLSGGYTPIALKHTASPSEGYLTEIKLLRDVRSTDTIGTDE